MSNKAYSLIKAEQAEAKGKYKAAVAWYQEVARECLEEAKHCRLLEKTMACVGR